MHKVTTLTIIALALATSVWAEEPMTVSPNDFLGSDVERINQAIQVGAANGWTVVIPKLNQRADAITETWLIDSAILVPENTNLELNNCHIKLSDQSRDNFIRSANCGLGITDITPIEQIHIYGVGDVLLEGADHPRSTGDSAKTIGVHTYGTDAGVVGESQTGDWRNIGILMAYVENFSIENLKVQDSHCWGISLERCGFGDIQDISFQSNGNMMIDGVKRTTLNQDGLDLRQGCHDINIERISGSTGDDLIALTNIALGGEGDWAEIGGEDTTMVSGLYKREGGVDDIRNISIHDVEGYAGGDHVVRFLNAGGLKIDNVTLDGVIDTSPPGSPCVATVKIGDSNPAWGGVTPLGDTSRLSISNVLGNSTNTILVAGSLVNSDISNVLRHDDSGDVITYASGTNNVQDVRFTNMIRAGTLRDLPIEDSIVEASWRFQESAGATTVADQTGRNDLTLTAAATLGVAGPSSLESLKLSDDNTAVRGDGTAPIATVRNVLGGTNGYLRDYTAAMWIKIDSSFTSGSQCLLYRNDLDNPDVNLEVGDFFGITMDEVTGEIRLMMTNGMLDETAAGYDGQNAWLVGRTALDTDKWYHVAMTSANNYTTLYVNGQQNASGYTRARIGYFLSDGTWTIGGAGDTPLDRFDPFIGEIDELTIYAGVLSQECLSLPGGEPIVEASWRFQESIGSTTVRDETGRNELVLTAAATLGVAGPSGLESAKLTDDNMAVLGDGTAPIATVRNVLGGTNGYQRNYSSEMWIKIDSSFTSGNQCLLYRNDLDNPEVNLEVGDFFGVTVDEESGEIHLVMTNGMLDETAAGYDGRNAWLVGGTALDTDTWYHVALSDNSNLVAIYLNGELDASGNVPARTGYFLGDGTWTVGGAGDTDLDRFDPFTGAIDELTIYPEILSQAYFQRWFVEAEKVPGDANSDGQVDGSDVTILAGNWQVLENATWEMGDFNGDGRVDGSDVTILAGNWQYGVGSTASAVPEPSTLLMLFALTCFLYILKPDLLR